MQRVGMNHVVPVEIRIRKLPGSVRAAWRLHRPANSGAAQTLRTVVDVMTRRRSHGPQALRGHYVSWAARAVLGP